MSFRVRLVWDRCEQQDDGAALLNLILDKKERTEMQYALAR